MAVTVSHYPRISEWIFIGDTAINLGQVTAIEFGTTDDSAHAVVRLSTYNAGYEVEEQGKTWFEVLDPELVRRLRAYVEQMRAPEIR